MRGRCHGACLPRASRRARRGARVGDTRATLPSNGRRRSVHERRCLRMAGGARYTLDAAFERRTQLYTPTFRWDPHEARSLSPDHGLPILRESAARPDMPLPPDMLGVRKGSDRDARCGARVVARMQAHRALQSVARGRFRPGPALAPRLTAARLRLGLPFGSPQAGERFRGKPRFSSVTSFTQASLRELPSPTRRRAALA
jgi:hypothetical protein